MNTVEKASSFIPAELLKWIEEGKLTGQFPAVVAFADASGFTAMSEKLAAIGKEGAETLTSILNSYFTAMISRIEQNGGFVGKFGGDAMTIFFPAKDESELPEVAKRAVATCIELQNAMEEFHNLETKAGTFTLGMKVGVSVGNVLFQVVGPEDMGREYLLAGVPLDHAAEAEHHGTSGEVILTPAMVKLCGTCGGEVLDDDFIKLVAESERPAYKKLTIKREYKPSWSELAKPFIDPPIFNRMELGLDSVGEIRLVSVIFMSFSGLNYDKDPDVTKKLDSIYNWVYDLSRRYVGSINKVDMGDKGSKMILTFGTPTAHEHSERHAVYCGLELVKGQEEFAKWGVKWKLGIATGVVFAGEVGAPTRQEYTVMGSTVNLSARLMAKCDTGQMLVDEATYNRTSDILEYAEPRKFKFKGISQPLPTYEPLRAKIVDRRKDVSLEKTLIGRKNELQIITEAFEKIINNELRVLIFRGDAGLGKSRLAQEAIHMADLKGFKIAGGEALSYADRSPFLIWISTVRGLMGLSLTAKTEDNLPRLENIVKEADPENTFRTPIIANLLGIDCPDNDVTRHFDAKLRQENMFDFMVQYLKYLSNRQPVALLFEDSQWIDRNSLELMAYLMRNLAENSIIFILVRRQYSKKFICPYISEIEESDHAMHIPICEFDRSETEQFILSCLDAISIDKDLLKFIFDSSHGNPSFTEVLLNNLRASENIRLVELEDGTGSRAESVGNLSEVEVPDSLNSLIMSQLDNLDTEAKLTVKVAAVIGRRFLDEVVYKAYPVELEHDMILKSIEELSDNDLIRSSDEVEFFNYIFKNLLTRDVAYDSLLFAHRREYHRRVGLCLEGIHTDNVKEQCDELARHFYQSEDHKRAVKYLQMAGDKAYDLYAVESANTYYTMGIERAEASQYPIERFQLLTMRSKGYDLLGEYELFRKNLVEALEIAENSGDLKRKVNTMQNLSRYYQHKNELKEMKRILDEALEILERFDYPFGRINIYEKVGACFYYQNNYKDALEWFQKSLTEAEKINDEKGCSFVPSQVGVAYKNLGDLDKAFEYYNRSLSACRAIGNKRPEAITLGNIGVLHHQRGDFDKASEAYEQSLEIARSIGWKEVQARNLGNLAVLYQRRGERQRALDTYQAKLSIEHIMGYRRGEVVTLGNIGMWYAEDGDYDTAISYYQQALKLAKELGMNAAEPQHMMNIGLSLQRRGELNQAREILEEAVQRSVEVNHKVAEDYARRYLGFVLIDLEELDQAEEQFKKAREVAEGIGSKVGIASAKVGLGWINMLKGGESDPLVEAINEARQVQDAETFIKGKMALAKVLIDRGEDKNKALEELKAALEVAKKAGMRRDINAIEPMIAELESD